MRTVINYASALFSLLMLALAMPRAVPAAIVVNLEDVHWTTVGDLVEFSIRLHNTGPDATEPGVGEVHAQQFGVFAPNLNLLHSFDIPPLQPNSFFDVFFAVELAELPPSAEAIEPHEGERSGRDLCSPDDHWDGNVDINWYVGGADGQVNYHVGTLMVCPTGGYSYIHVLNFCPGPSTWSFSGVCPGWTAELIEEDLMTPSVPMLPPMWTGWIRLSADGSVNEGDTCNPSLTIVCGEQPGVINLEAVACVCGPVPVEPSAWGTLKSLYD